jgi:hypothetical protein
MGRAFHGADPILIAFFSIDIEQVHDFSFFRSKIPDPAWEFNMPGSNGPAFSLTLTAKRD